MILFVTAPGALAQKSGTGRISGKITDRASGHPLEAVTLSIVAEKDSSLLDYTSTNASGAFKLSSLPLDRQLELFITRKGYQDTFLVFRLSAARPSLDSIHLSIPVQPIELQGVNITARRAPFTYRNDTLEFNATAYKLIPNATVRQLLSKLPGVVIADNGSITVNGKSVSKIQLDGRDFFNGDLNAATKNLPGDIIEKVQVTTYKSLEQRRSLSVTKPSDEVAINLTLKKEKKQGVVGTVMAGAGTSSRYLANGNATLLGPVRLSAYGVAANAPLDARARFYGSMAGGISDNKSLGLNLNTDLNKKLKLDANYGFNGSETERNTLTERLNFLPDSSFAYNSDVRTTYRNDGHNLNANITYEADSLTSWNINTRGEWGRSSSNSLTSAVSETTDGKVLNTMESRVRDNSSNTQLSADINFNKTSRNRRMNLSMQYRGILGRVNGDGHNSSVNTFSNTPDNVIDQRSEQQEQLSNNSVNTALSVKLGQYFVLTGNYMLSYNATETTRETYNFDNGTGKYTERDSLLSNRIKNTIMTQAPGFQLAYRTEKFGIGLNGSWRFTEQRNRLVWEDSLVTISQQQFTPELQLNRSFGKGDFFLNYAVSSQPPNQQQLAPIVDNSNPLYVRVGNPNLKASLQQRINLGLNIYDPEKGLGMYMALNGNLTGNDIVEDISYDSLSRQVITYRNVNGVRQLMLMTHLSKSGKLGAWKVSEGVGLNVRQNNQAGVVSGQQNDASTWMLGGSLRGTIGWKELFTLQLSAGYGWNKSSNSIASLPGTEYATGNYGFGLEMQPAQRMELNVGYAFTYNGQVSPALGKRVKVMNASVGYRFLKKQQLTLYLEVNDIFNDSQNVTRVINASYIENRTVNVLRRFALLKLKYNFDKFSVGGISATPSISL